MQLQDQQVRESRPSRQTLPRNFTFHYHERPPKTPEPIEPRRSPEQSMEPPKLRIRRRRHLNGLSNADISSDFVLPSIELPTFAHDFTSVHDVGSSELQDGFLAPATARSLKRYGRIIEAPKTPLDQIFNAFDEAVANPNWTPHRPLDPISRPSSVFSDSSESSSSSDSSPSFEEGCTSPEGEFAEGFVFPQMGNGHAGLSSPLNFHRKPTKSGRPHTKVRWTSEMDDHLWQTYTSYCADPTVTPFKMLPGTAPPLGVCHRVAREAKKNWKAPRPSLQPIAEDQSGSYLSLDAALSRESSAAPIYDLRVNALRPNLNIRGLSNADVTRKALMKWPRSEASTRRRLRELCKRKPTLSPHYQRLMQSRSPSPFSMSSSRSERRSSRFASPPAHADAESVFSTRDLNITLATSTAASMQPDGPLSQLADDGRKPRPFSTDWNPRTTRPGAAHQKSQSLHLSLGLNTLSSRQLESLRQLASPFDPRPESQPPGEQTPARLPAVSESAPLEPEDIFTTDPIIHHPRPLSGSMKRRAQYPLGEEMVSSDPNARRSFLEGLFRGPETHGHRRVRSRGFSIGHAAHVRHLSEVFTPPSRQDEGPSMPSMPSQPEISQHHFSQMEGQLLSPPHVDHVRRLGSPFAPNPNVRFSHTFPRSVFPEGLDSLSALEEHQGEQAHRPEHQFGLDGAFSSATTRF